MDHHHHRHHHHHHHASSASAPPTRAGLALVLPGIMFRPHRRFYADSLLQSPDQPAPAEFIQTRMDHRYWQAFVQQVWEEQTYPRRYIMWPGSLLVLLALVGTPSMAWAAPSADVAGPPPWTWPWQPPTDTLSVLLWLPVLGLHILWNYLILACAWTVYVTTQHHQIHAAIQGRVLPTWSRRFAAHGMDVQYHTPPAASTLFVCLPVRMLSALFWLGPGGTSVRGRRSRCCGAFCCDCCCYDDYNNNGGGGGVDYCGGGGGSDPCSSEATDGGDEAALDRRTSRRSRTLGYDWAETGVLAEGYFEFTLLTLPPPDLPPLRLPTTTTTKTTLTPVSLHRVTPPTSNPVTPWAPVTLTRAATDRPGPRPVSSMSSSAAAGWVPPPDPAAAFHQQQQQQEEDIHSTTASVMKSASAAGWVPPSDPATAFQQQEEDIHSTTASVMNLELHDHEHL